MFFSFDGIDGAGKSTQINRLADWLREQGRDVIVCRDPGSTQLGEALRDILLGNHGADIHARSEMLIYMAARAQLVEELIRPALAQGKSVVCDRFLLANVVYQGHAGGVDLKSVRDTGRIAVSEVYPDLTILLDLDPATALARLDRPFDRMESKGIAFLERVRSGFLEESKRDEYRAVTIDAIQSPDEIHAEVIEAVKTVMPNAPSQRGAKS